VKSVFLLFALAAFVPACSAKDAQNPNQGNKHYFEGTLEWSGVEGKPPGKPWTLRCSMRGEDLLCDVASARDTTQVGFRGTGSTVCIRPKGSPMWIPLSLQTVGFLFSLLPDDIRQDAVKKTQSSYAFTNQTQQYLGRTCRTLDVHDSDGAVETACYSPDEFFEGDQKLAPVLRQMGVDPAFVSMLSGYGIGYRIYKADAAGQPKLAYQITRMDAGPVAPATFAGVCGMP
jgi:hypothetical protein